MAKRKIAGAVVMDTKAARTIAGAAVVAANTKAARMIAGATKILARMIAEAALYSAG